MSAKFDVWSWALVVLQLFAVPLPTWPGRRPTTSAKQMWIDAVQNQTLSQAPEDLRDMLAQCLHFNANERPEFSKIIAHMMQYVKGDYNSWSVKRGGYYKKTVWMQQQRKTHASILCCDWLYEVLVHLVHRWPDRWVIVARI